jgi:hypothetical protein
MQSWNLTTWIIQAGIRKIKVTDNDPRKESKNQYSGGPSDDVWSPLPPVIHQQPIHVSSPVQLQNCRVLKGRYNRCRNCGVLDPSNLWPQLRRSIEPKWNAEADDRLEHRLCEMVCTGSTGYCDDAGSDR